MANIICVTCRRDFNDFKRQLVSFKNNLQPHHSITYIVEDSDLLDSYYTFVNTINIAHNISIFSYTKFLPINNTHGHIRQQLLKLLATANSSEEECWVIDSKDFLIDKPDSNSIDPLPPIDPDPNRDPHFILKEKYCKKFNFKYVDKLSLPWTPFKLIKTNVSGLIDILGINDFIEWFLSESGHCEFYLYQLYCHTNNIVIDYKNKELVIKLWPYIEGVEPTTEYSELVKEKLLKTNIQWISKHRWAHHTWNTEIKDLWKHILNVNNLNYYDEFYDVDKHEFTEFIHRNCKNKE